MLTGKSIILLTLYAIFGLLIYINFVSFVGKGAVEARPDIVRKVSSILPQGWGFFTRDPREDITEVYRYDNNKQFERFIRNNAEPAYLFGAIRTGRIRSLELGQILSHIADSNWIRGTGNYYRVADSLHAIPITWSSLTQSFTPGNYLLIKQQRPPWIWQQNINSSKIPFKAVMIKITKS